MASLRGNFGCPAKRFSGPQGNTRVFAQEHATLKAQVDLPDLIAFARQAAGDGMRDDDRERSLRRRLLQRPVARHFHGAVWDVQAGESTVRTPAG
jgi:hypothetical protein